MIAMAFSGMMLIAAAPAQASPPPQGQTLSVQQRFDSANARLDANEPERALLELDALEADLVKRRSPINLALVRILKAQAYMFLKRFDDARAAYATALVEQGLARPDLAPQREAAIFAYGNLLEVDLDHAGAHAQFLKLSEISTNITTRIVALTSLARTEMFVDATNALAHADAALALAQSSELGKRELATVLGVKGRVLLNMGRLAEARDALTRAVSLKGGLDLRVNATELTVRADAAVAYLRLGDADKAREYFAYTGAGRTRQQLEVPANRQPVPCGGIANIKPEDFAIIELTIDPETGAVLTAQPVYSSRPGEVAYDFARGTTNWVWQPESIAKIPRLFLNATRVQVRCSNAQQRPPLSYEAGMALDQWLASQGKPVRSASELVAVPLKTLDEELKAAAGGDLYARLAALVNRYRSPQVGRADTDIASREALTLVRQSDAPAAAKLSVAIANAYAPKGTFSNESSNRLTALLLDPDIAQDPVSRATVNMALAENYGWARAGKKERAAVEAVTNDKALDDHHPIKISALVALANLEALEKRLDAARAAYDRTGLSAGQCALIDKPPVLMGGTGSSSDFPDAALKWGFEGWTMLEFDIGADGKTRNVRTIMAYPPEVFADASEKILEGARYRASFRPETDLGCGAMTRGVRFSIP